MITEWHCTRCSATGRVSHGKYAGVWEVYQRIVERHAQQARKLTGCDKGVTAIRVSIPKDKKS